MALLFLKNLLIQKDVERKRLLRDEENDSIDVTNHETGGDVTSKTCRVCGGGGEIDIFSGYCGRNLAEDMRLCSGVPVYINDGFAKWLCVGCLQLLQYAVKFRQMCRRSTARLLKMRLDASFQETNLVYGEMEYEPGDHSSEGFAETSSPETEAQRKTSVLKICRLCKQQFHDTSTFRQHVRLCRQSRARMKKERVKKAQVNGAKDHLCETCGKALSSIHSLISHRTIHQNIFPYKCDLCPYRGKTAGLLRTHRKIHFSDKPHACSQCPKAFRTSSNLRKHMHVHKGLQEPVQCAMCDKTLRNKETLRGHINSVHIHRPPVSCNVCGKQFKATRALYKHRSKIHNWRAEFTGRLPAYMLCQPEDMEPLPQESQHQNLVITEP